MTDTDATGNYTITGTTNDFAEGILQWDDPKVGESVKLSDIPDNGRLTVTVDFNDVGPTSRSLTNNYNLFFQQDITCVSILFSAAFPDYPCGIVQSVSTMPGDKSSHTASHVRLPQQFLQRPGSTDASAGSELPMPPVSVQQRAVSQVVPSQSW